MDKKKKPASATPEVARSIINAMSILEALQATDDLLTLSELSERCNLSKATAMRYLGAFEQGGYVSRNARDGKYALGAKIVQLAQRFYMRDHLLMIASGSLRSLAEQCGETSHLAVLDETEVIYLDIVDSQQRVQAVVRRGDRAPAYCVASGRAILAQSEKDAVDAVLSHGLSPMTNRTVTDESKFLALLAQGREDGYFVSAGEFVEDIVGISVPLFAPDGRVFAAIGVSFPSFRTTSKDIEVVGQLIKKHAEDISRSFKQMTT
ncbi:IclR family transcriptional regulator [Castellaniella sp.]|uniref:IclR family transcriptional regulator n=1 Tax=Castellaniella sp. TaxID=1955812 RepID=UPI003C747D8A